MGEDTLPSILNSSWGSYYYPKFSRGYSCFMEIISMIYNVIPIGARAAHVTDLAFGEMFSLVCFLRMS